MTRSPFERLARRHTNLLTSFVEAIICGPQTQGGLQSMVFIESVASYVETTSYSTAVRHNSCPRGVKHPDVWSDRLVEGRPSSNCCRRSCHDKKDNDC